MPSWNDWKEELYPDDYIDDNPVSSWPSPSDFTKCDQQKLVYTDKIDCVGYLPEYLIIN